MTKPGFALRLERAIALAYRAEVHDLERPVASLADCGVLEVGIQDTPPGLTAGQALAARVTRLPEAANPAAHPALVLLHSMRGTLHLHRAADLPLLTAALRPDDARDLSPAVHGQFLTERADQLPDSPPALSRAPHGPSSSPRSTGTRQASRTRGTMA